LRHLEAVFRSTPSNPPMALSSSPSDATR
jgi:hypothetical protein